HRRGDLEVASLRGPSRAALDSGRRAGEAGVSYTDEEISRAARQLRREWESPELWPRIQAALAAEAARIERRRAPSRVSAWLTLLDSAIAECRAGIDRNRFNARLRRELLSRYQEKQHTLQQVMKEDPDAL